MVRDGDSEGREIVAAGDFGEISRMVHEFAANLRLSEMGAHGSQDVAQKTLLRLHGGGLEKYRGATLDSLRAFLYQCVLRSGLEIRKSERRRLRREESYASQAPEATDPSHATIDLLRILERLSRDHPRCCRILIQAFLHATPYRELAEEWNKTVGAVKKNVFDCMRRARRLVEG